MPPRDRLYAALAAVILVADLVTKRWAEAALALHQPVEVLGHWLRWTLTYNRGAAMNLSAGEASRVVFTLVAIVIVGVLWRSRRQLPAGPSWTAAAFGLVSGGAVGNLVDRLRHDLGVVDFIDVGTQAWRFWTFNVADCGVTVGAAILLVTTWGSEPERITPPASSP